MLDILHHHHGAIDQKPDGDGQASQRHNIRRPAEQPHDDECRENRQRKTRRHHDGGSKIAEKQHEQNDDQHDGLDQHALHRPHGFFDQLIAVVENHDLRALRQQRFDFLQFFLHATDDDFCVRAAQTQHCGPHRLAFRVRRDDTVARQRAFAHLGNVADAHRGVGFDGHDGIAHIVERADAAL